MLTFINDIKNKIIAGDRGTLAIAIASHTRSIELYK